MIPTLALLSLIATAQAQQPPLAVPAGPSTVTPEKLRALRMYKANRLTLQDETELRGGGAWSMGGVWGPGWGGPGWGWGGYTGPVMVDPITQVRTWGIYQGPERVDVPTFLEMAGATERKQDLETEVARLKKRTTAWGTLAALGGAAVVSGLVGMSASDEIEQYRTWNIVSLGGTGVLTAGLIGTSFPRGRASSLRKYPSASMTSAQAQTLVDDHNEGLREELGLSAADVWALEAN